MGQRGNYIKNVFGCTDIALHSGEHLLVGQPAAFGSEFRTMIEADKPGLTERVIMNISTYASHGAGRLHEVLLQIDGWGTGPLSAKGISDRVMALVRKGTLLALILPAVTLTDIKTDGRDLEIISADVIGGEEVNTKIGVKGARFSDLKSMKDKLVYVIRKCPDYFSKRKVFEAFKAALTPLALISVAVVLAAWAASHFAGVGFAIDAVLLAIGWIMIGWGIFSAMKKLLKCLKMIKNANSLADLDKAAELMADAIVMLGVDTFIGLLTRGAGRLKKAPGPKQKASGGGASGSKSKADVKAENQAKADAKKAKADAKPTTTKSGKPHATYTGNGPVYRGDSRKPDEIFEDGFQPKGGTDDLEDYVQNNTSSNYVGTSTDVNVAKGDYFTNGGDGYVYKIDSKGIEGVDVNKTLGEHMFSSEKEIAFHGGIPTSKIVGARKVMPGGGLGPIIHNPNYAGGG